MPCLARHPLEGLIVSRLYNDIKRRLLREVVQANLAMYTVAPSATPLRVERRLWATVGRRLFLAAALVLMLIDAMSTVIGHSRLCAGPQPFCQERKLIHE